MKQGVVIRMMVGKNFGFILDELKNHYFFHRDDFSGHWRDLESDFSNGAEIRVQFDEAPPKEKKGYRACNISRLDYPNQAVTDELGYQQSQTAELDTKSARRRR